MPILVLFFGVLGVSSGAIFARMADAHPLVISAYRVGIASCVLVPAALIFGRKEYRLLRVKDIWGALAAGIFLAAHFAVWITSLSYTTIASSVVFVNTAPIWTYLAGVVGGVRHKGRVTPICVGLSFVGAAIVGYGDFSFSGEALWGDFLALLGAVFVTGYLICGKSSRARLSLLSYVALCYATASVVLWAVVLSRGYPVTGFSDKTWAALFGMAVFAQIIGHSCYNWALRYFSAGFVAIALLGEPIGGTVLAKLLFNESPTPIKLAGIACILASIVLAGREEGA